MLYEIFWLVFALMVGIFMSIGILGLAFSPSIPTKPARIVAMILSLLILLAGIYFSYRWNADKREIRAWSGQAEQAIKIYLDTHKKDAGTKS
jgi:disulfide bond formation protein DsbB